MPTYGTLEAKNRFSELIERAERGEEVVVTRHGKPVVRISAVNALSDEKRKHAADAIEWIRANRPKTGISIEEIKEMINEGRR
ncbi:MAG: type II toxin-antitoxin system prevent-host-death family antitoxin [Rhizobiaceae bacterium]|jgi:prevent-host-death family protein|nr:type II toxin-antitoxin system prevent-host-death family antitoxin [Rhizobiaceae bacterium]